jgi:hypothetical protein
LLELKNPVEEGEIVRDATLTATKSFSDECSLKTEIISAIHIQTATAC